MKLKSAGNKEEAEAAAAAAAKKGKKPPPKAENERLPEEDMPIDESEEATEEFAEALPEPQFEPVEGSDKKLKLKVSVVSDYARYKCDVDKVIFKPTMMFGSRSFKFRLKNISSIALHYNFKITNASSGISDSGPFSISPRNGVIPAGTDEILVVTFSPEEVNRDFSRLLK